MKLQLIRRDDTVEPRLLDTDDLERFSLEAPEDLDLGQANSELEEVVRFESSERAWVNQAWLRHVGEFAADPVRDAAFAEMVDAARKHGWVDAERGDIAVHVVREGRS